MVSNVSAWFWDAGSVLRADGGDFVLFPPKPGVSAAGVNMLSALSTLSIFADGEVWLTQNQGRV
jgi:hypothetical protein